MDKFEVNVLGCGSALPTTRHFLSSQVLNHREKLYMIDCGEGTQLQFRAMKLKFQRLSHIFISHLHGDHCFGLLGLVSTLGLLGRTGDLYIHAQPDAEKIFKPMLDYFCKESPYKIIFNSFNPNKSELILDDRSLKVSTIPLKHRVPTAGFLFEEKPKAMHIIREMVDYYNVPIRQINALKNGEDFVLDDGTIIPNKIFTKPAEPSYRYAYCSDTVYSEKIIPIIEGVDLLYHEATFSQQDIARAKETLHTSAKQAALIAKTANVKRLLLGHFSARYPDESVLLNEAQEVFPNTILAKEGMSLSVNGD
ncbi:ribonuclease Z [Dysgonomonadaceae bacterium PH5-43]|nr:ribonuclease Z [Dysgonomonadaceae bacterium PH5-43]